MLKRWIILYCGAMFLAGPALAASADPDLSTPNAAAKSLYLAVQKADPRAIEQIFYAADDSQKELCQCFVDLLVAGRKLEDAVRAKYGQADANLAAGMFTEADLARYDKAKPDIHGDTADLTPEGQSRPLKFKLVGGQWKLIVTDYAGASDANLPQQVQTLKAMTQALLSSASEIDAGKYPTADEAEAAMQQKFHAVIEASVRRNPPTTQK